MKRIVLSILLTAIGGFHANAMASGVFKCIGSEGEMTFSYAPCASPEPAPAVQQVAVKEQVIPRVAHLAIIDADIARLEERLQDERDTYRKSLANRQTSANDLTSEFDANTSSLLAELSRLQAERDQVLQN